jgi:hypothetical protein
LFKEERSSGEEEGFDTFLRGKSEEANQNRWSVDLK